MTYTDSLKKPKKIYPSDDYVPLFLDDVYGPEASGSGVVRGAPIQMTLDKVRYPGAIPFPVSKVVTTYLYVNLSGTLVKGHDTGRIDIRAVRVGTIPPNDTALDSPIVKGVDGGWYQRFHTHPEWKGANPKGFVWQIRCGLGVANIVIGTHYVKHYGIAVVS